MLGMGSEDETTPRPNVLHRRYQQLQKWKGSETDQSSDQVKDNTKVQFPLPIQFLAACSNNDTPEVKRLLDLGIDINVANVDGLTALHQACIDNDLDLVEFLVRHNADVNVQDNEGWTPLHATASCGYLEVAKCLIENGANLAVVSYDIELASDVAQGDEMIHFLLEEMEKQNIDGQASRSHEETVMLADARRWLETNDYCPVIDSRTRASPLHVAASKEYLEVMRVLLQIPEVMVDGVDCDGWTPLHAASHWGKKAACRVLTEAGANMNALTFANQTLFEVADDDMGPTLRSLKEEQRLINQRKINIPDPVITRPDSNRVRRSSITRMSVDEKQNLAAKTVEEERDRLKQLVTLKLDVEQMDDKKPELNNGVEPLPPPSPDLSSTTLGNKTPSDVKLLESLKPPPAPKKPDLSTIEEIASDDKNISTNPAEKFHEEEKPSITPNQNSNHIDTPAANLPEEPAKSIKDKEPVEDRLETADNQSESPLANDTGKGSDSFTTSRWRSRLANEENDRRRGANYPPRNIGPASSALSSSSDELSKSSNEEMKPSDTNEGPSPAQLRTRRNFRPDRTADYMQKRVSAVMAPTKGDETETQRSSKARHVRSIRRSTQGVTQEEMDEAKKLIGLAPNNSNMSTDNSTLINDTASHSVVDGPISNKSSVEPATDIHRSSRWSSRFNDDSTGSKNVDSVSSPTPLSSDSNVPSRSVSFQDPTGARSSSYLSRTRPASQLELRTNSSGGLVSSSSPLSSSTSIALSPGRPQSVTSTASVTLLSSGAGNNSSVVQANQSDAQIDYRRLYEEERATRERLERRLDQQKKELTDSRAEIQRIKDKPTASSGFVSFDSKRQEDKLKEYEKQIKEIEKLKAENTKMKEENGSLIRVISKLSANKKP